MKKKLLFLVLLLVVVALAIFRISDRVPSADYPLDKRVAAIFVKGGCLDCHSAEPTLPFYFKLPVVGNIMKRRIPFLKESLIPPLFIRICFCFCFSICISICFCFCICFCS